MEAFEQVVKVYLEARNYIVTSGAKFPVAKKVVKRNGRVEVQTHGYEVDLVGARYGSLLLGSVKSYFGSAGVRRQGFQGLADPARRTHFKRYSMFNDVTVRDGILAEASKRYGYPSDQIKMALFVGKFHRPDEEAVRDHLRTIVLPGGPVEVVGLQELVNTLREVSARKMYINDAVVMTLKVLRSAGLLVDGAPAIPDAAKLGEFTADDEDDDDSESE